MAACEGPLPRFGRGPGLSESPSRAINAGSALPPEERSGDPMADTQTTDNASPRTAVSAPKRLGGWLFPILRIAFLIFAAWLIWYTAGHWDRWTGAARFETTDDAFVAGDVTPLSARVSGNITEMPVNDFQIVKKGDLIAVIDPSDYQAQLDLAQANLAAAQAALANLENQRNVQQALVREAESTIDATEADVLRYQLEDKRQRDLLRTGIAGTQQLVEQADDNAKRALAQRRLNDAQLDQQKAALAAIDIQEKQLQAQIQAAEAQVALAADNLRYTRILSPADGLVGQRQVRLGQFVNVGTQVIAVVPLPNIWVIANYKETQMTDIRRRPAGPHRRRRLSRSHAHRPCGQLVAGDRQHLRAASARQRDRQLHQSRAARSGEDRARPERFAWIAGAARHVGRGDDRHRRACQPRAGARRKRRVAAVTAVPAPLAAAAPTRPSPAPITSRRHRRPRERSAVYRGSAPIRSGPMSAFWAF